MPDTDETYIPKIVRKLPDKFTFIIKRDERDERVFHINSDAHRGFHMIACNEAELSARLAACPAALLMLLDAQARSDVSDDLTTADGNETTIFDIELI